MLQQIDFDRAGSIGLSDIAYAYLAAVRSSDLTGRIDQLYAPDAVLIEGHWEEGVGAPVRGREAIRALMEARDGIMQLRSLEIEGPMLAGESDGCDGTFAVITRFVLQSVQGRPLQRVASVSTFEVQAGMIRKQVIYLSPTTSPVEPASRWAAGLEGAGSEGD